MFNYFCSRSIYLFLLATDVQGRCDCDKSSSEGHRIVRCVSANITILSSSSLLLLCFDLDFLLVFVMFYRLLAPVLIDERFLRDVYLELFLRSVGRATSWAPK